MGGYNVIYPSSQFINPITNENQTVFFAGPDGDYIFLRNHFFKHEIKNTKSLWPSIYYLDNNKTIMQILYNKGESI